MSSNSSKALLIHDEAGESSFELLSSNVVVGRDASCDLPLNDREISRRHVELRGRDGRWFVVDLGSANGTSLNGERLPANVERPFLPGDELRVGTTLLSLPGLSPAAAKGVSAAAPARRRLWVPAGVAVMAIAGLGFVVIKGMESSDVLPAERSQQVATADLSGEESATKTSIPLSEEGVTSGESANAAEEFAIPYEADSAVDRQLRLMGRFEDALASGEFRKAEAAASRLGRPAALVTRLEESMTAELESVRREAHRLAKSKDADVATFLKGAMARFPAGSAVATELVSLGFELSPAIPEPVVAVRTAPRVAPKAGNIPPRGDVAATNPTPASNTSRRVEPASAGGRGPTGSGVSAPRHEVALLEKRLGLIEERLANRDYDNAKADLSELLAEAEIGRAFGVVERVERRLRDVGHFETFVTAMANAPKSLGTEFGSVTYGGAKVPVVSVDGQGLHVLVGGSATAIPWRIASSKHLEAVAKKVPLDPKALVSVSALLLAGGQEAEGERLLARAVKAAPGDADVKASIDQVLADARDTRVPSEGFTYEGGTWRSPQQLARAGLNKQIDKLVSQLSSSKEDDRAAAFSGLLELGPAARSSLHRGLLAARVDVLRKLETHKSWGRMQEMLAVRANLDKARDLALELIFDQEKYPYPYDPARGGTAETLRLYQENQPIVDERTAQLKKIWDDPRAVAIGDGFRDLVFRLREVNTLMERSEYGETPGIPGWLMSLPAAGSVTIQSLALTTDERERIDRSAEVLKLNETLAFADNQEKDQCRITNEYRVMLGRYALRLHDPMVRAAREHSQDMERLGFFSHTSPVAGKKGPTDRLKMAGMEPVGAGENIAICGGPAQAHHGWLHSPGHHRNILNAGWRIMGVSYAARRWTQVFAVADRNENK